jgi:16S rRNA (uracil1498-N3)-methyltransferase
VTHERRIFLDIAKYKLTSGELSLPEDVKHYLFSVLRIKEGDEVTVGDRTYSPASLPTQQNQPDNDNSPAPHPKIYKTRATSSHTLKILSEITAHEPPHAVICVAPALAKGDTNDIIIEKSIELGIAHIAIWQSNRSIPVLRNQADIDKKIKRWSKIAAAAAQQSGRSLVPNISFFSSAADLLESLFKHNIRADHSLLICSLSSNAVPVGNLSKKLDTNENQPRCFSIIIGPEGDFTPEEEERFLEGKAIPISLGQRRLKVDTAAISAIAMLDVLFSASHKDYS